MVEVLLTRKEAETYKRTGLIPEKAILLIGKKPSEKYLERLDRENLKPSDFTSIKVWETEAIKFAKWKREREKASNNQ